MRGRAARDRGLSMYLFRLYIDECLTGNNVGPVYVYICAEIIYSLQ